MAEKNTPRRSETRRISSVPTANDRRLGLPLILLLIYLVMEYGRPAEPLKIPLIISAALFLSWLAQPDKRWPPQLVCFVLLLGTIAVMIPFAVNSYSIVTGFRTMTVQLLCICTPLMYFVTSMRKLRIFLGAWIAVFAYLAVYGLTHAGTGPGGHIGDENDLALALDMAIPVAFAFMWTARSVAARAASAMAFVLMVVVVGVTFSRGGFLGLAAVLLYCGFVMTRRKTVAIVILALAMLALSAAPQAYRDRLATILAEVDGSQQGTGALRREYWEVARTMFYENPVFGVGLDNFTWNIDEYQSEEHKERVGRSYAGQVAHSVYFTVLAELGTCGAVLFGLLIVYTVRDTGRVLRIARRAKTLRGNEGRADPTLHQDLEAARLYAHAIRAALISYLLSGAFLSVLTYPHFWVLVALGVALRDCTRTRLALPLETVPAARRTTTDPRQPGRPAADLR
jgi:O-antigen ligase